MLETVPCFYLPKQIMTPDYADFSVESKMLFSMIFTNAEHIKTIIETAQLIENIGERELYNMRRLQEGDFSAPLTSDSFSKPTSESTFSESEE